MNPKLVNEDNSKSSCDNTNYFFYFDNNGPHGWSAGNRLQKFTKSQIQSNQRLPSFSHGEIHDTCIWGIHHEDEVDFVYVYLPLIDSYLKLRFISFLLGKLFNF